MLRRGGAGGGHGPGAVAGRKPIPPGATESRSAVRVTAPRDGDGLAPLRRPPRSPDRAAEPAPDGRPAPRTNTGHPRYDVGKTVKRPETLKAIGKPGRSW
ncbi:hypothetical protein GCM10010376_71470 [Streptomyces violaceusniger]